MAGNKAYFIAKDKIKEGPFSFEELIKHEIYDSTLIWKTGWDEWKEAKDVVELAEFVIQSPPPTPNEKKQEKQRQRNVEVINFLKANSIMALMSTIILGLTINFTLYNYGKDGGSNEYPIYLTKEQRVNPSLLFWQFLPYSLMFAGAISFIGLGLITFVRAKNSVELPKQSEPNSEPANTQKKELTSGETIEIINKYIDYQAIGCEVLINGKASENCIVRLKNEDLRYEIKDGKILMEFYIEKYRQKDGSILELDGNRIKGIARGSRAWINNSPAPNGTYKAGWFTTVTVENGVIMFFQS